MKDGFRIRMGSLHTWAGLVLSALLFAIFWTGTLSVFDKEIDRWMMPETRIRIDDSLPRLSVDRDIRPLLPDLAEGATAWTIVFPNERSPFLSLSYNSAASHIAARKRFHPATLTPLPAARTRGASNFIYPFHHNLTLRQNNIGAWLVGIASMGMLCLLISGVVIHRKLFAEFFTLRLLRRFGRANLDVHNLSGVVLLPFALVITLSGLIVAHLIYFPNAPDAIYAGSHPASQAALKAEAGARANAASLPVAPAREGSRSSPARRQFTAQGQGLIRPPRDGRAAGIASLDQMVADAEREFGPGSIASIRVNHPGDTGGIAAVRRSNAGTVIERADSKRFFLASGTPAPAFAVTPTNNVWSFIGGLHYLHFSHWLLRWLYFLAGLGACLMIATGLLHWTQARNKGRRASRWNVALMNALSTSAVTGLIAATGAFLLSNRLLHGRESFLGIVGRELEVQVFYGVWLLCVLHAVVMVLWRPQHGYLAAWAQQCWAIAVMALAAVGLNALTTGEHLLKTLWIDPYWPVAAMDLSLLAAASLAVWVARKLYTARRQVLDDHLAEQASPRPHTPREARHV